MNNIPTLEEQFMIEEILNIANRYGLKTEVIESAEEILLERKGDESFTLLDAYYFAFKDWVK